MYNIHLIFDFRVKTFIMKFIEDNIQKGGTTRLFRYFKYNVRYT